jgi:sialic acid synthase
VTEFKIKDTTITHKSKPFFIAEIGNNHQTSMELCKTLIHRAKVNGADAVKLQKRDPKSLYTKSFYDSPYDHENSFGKTYGTHREALEFNKDQWKELVLFAESEQIPLISSVFDLKSLEFLENLNLPAYKVASACLQDIPLINSLASTGKPLIISVGGADWVDVDRVYSLMCVTDTSFAFLQCTMQYPTEPSNVNLRTIAFMNSRYPVIIGFSDHTVGSWAIPAAYCYGAQIFEKHFTTNKSLPGPDHSLSIEPDELQSIIHTLDRIYAARGTGDKCLLPCEEKALYKMGKGIYAARAIPAGHPIGLGDLCIKSPADGLSPSEWWNVIGSVAMRDVGRDEPVTREVIE